MERGFSDTAAGLPPGYIHQHTLWTRATFNARSDSKQWRSKRGMIMLMPYREEKAMHAEFSKIFSEPDRHGGLPLPSSELTRVALAHLNATSPLLGRKQQFESMSRYMRELANTATVREQADEARLFSNHFARQLDYYDNVLTAADERDLGLWTPDQRAS